MAPPPPPPAWQALGLLLVSIIGRAIVNRFTQLQQTHAGYFMVANKRIAIGDKLKRVPMGYFNDKSLGELTGITTTVLDEVENTGPMVLVNILSGLINSLVMLPVCAGMGLALGSAGPCGHGALFSAALGHGTEICRPCSQAAGGRGQDGGDGAGAAQGMSIIKSFNLTGKGDQKVRQALEDSHSSNLGIEKLFTPYIMAQEMVLQLSSVLILIATVAFFLNGTISLANAPDGGHCGFPDFFRKSNPAGGGVSALRLVGSSIDHANQVDGIPEMDERARRSIPKPTIFPLSTLIFPTTEKTDFEGRVHHHPG